eukprot:scaffold168047_cov53-Prasinocladus_malaysianus.AAC.1
MHAILSFSGPEMAGYKTQYDYQPHASRQCHLSGGFNGKSSKSRNHVVVLVSAEPVVLGRCHTGIGSA